MWCILNFLGRSYFPGEAIFREKPFSGEKPFLGRSRFWGEAIFKKTLLPLPCKECSKSFSESGSLKIHLTLIQEKSHLLLNNFPNHFHKRKSVMPFKDSKNSNLISTLSLLHHFCHCPFLSSNMSLSVFWLLRRWLTTILQRIFEMRKEKLLSGQSHFQIVLSRQLVWHS